LRPRQAAGRFYASRYSFLDSCYRIIRQVRVGRGCPYGASQGSGRAAGERISLMAPPPSRAVAFHTGPRELTDDRRLVRTDLSEDKRSPSSEGHRLGPMDSNYHQPIHRSAVWCTWRLLWADPSEVSTASTACRHNCTQLHPRKEGDAKGINHVATGKCGFSTVTVLSHLARRRSYQPGH
jgi:hypothetical protein